MPQLSHYYCLWMNHQTIKTRVHFFLVCLGCGPGSTLLLIPPSVCVLTIYRPRWVGTRPKGKWGQRVRLYMHVRTSCSVESVCYDFCLITNSCCGPGQTIQQFQVSRILWTILLGQNINIPLAPMGVFAPGSAQARPSARAPINTSGNFLAHLKKQWNTSARGSTLTLL